MKACKNTTGTPLPPESMSKIFAPACNALWFDLERGRTLRNLRSLPTLLEGHDPIGVFAESSTGLRLFSSKCRCVFSPN